MRDSDLTAMQNAVRPGHLDLHVDPAYPRLAHAVLDWFADLVPGAVRTVTVLDSETHLVDALGEAGYRPDDAAPYFLHCVIDLDDLPEPRLPDGFRLRGLRPDEAEARAALHRVAWRPSRIGAMLVPPVDLGDGESGMTGERYAKVMAAWPYRCDLDQVVEAPDGTLVAQALGWLDEAGEAGELEPVGTDPGYARRGLGTAVSLGALRALRTAGAARAVVYPRGDDAYPVPRRLYSGLGFRPVGRTITYTRRSPLAAAFSERRRTTS